jgi:RNA polymerase sigma factor (sigma-70 family)
MKRKSQHIVTKIIGKVQIRKYTEEELIEGVKNISPVIIRYIRAKNLGAIRKMISYYNPGRYLEAEDIIQDGLVILVDKIRLGEFDKRSKINTYFFGICKNICLKAMRQDQKIKLIYNSEGKMDKDENLHKDYTYNGFLTNEYDPAELLKMAKNIIKTMETICVRIFDLRFGLFSGNYNDFVIGEKRGFTEIAQLMEMSEVNARQKYHRCLTRLLSEYARRKSELLQ